MANQPTATTTFTTTISVDEALYAEFKKLAALNHRTPRQEVRHLIAEYVKRETERSANGN